MKKELYIIDGIRIWATSRKEAQEHYEIIIRI